MSSELLEAGRVAQLGMPSAARTLLISSTHRAFTVTEKASMADGRVDADKLQAALARSAKRLVLFDMDRAARDAGTVVSAVMLGAIAAAGVVPLSRAAFEDAIRGGGRGAEASLKGFAAGYAAMEHDGADAAPERAGLAGRVVPAALREQVGALRMRFPAALRPLVEEGFLRLADYQSERYASLYVDRVARVLDAERAAGSLDATQAVARFLALWMSYEDVIRVADLKSRASRHARVRSEVGARADDKVDVIEFLKPGVEELCSVLPPSLAARVRQWAMARAAKGKPPLQKGMHINTTALHGFLMMRLLATLKPWRPRTSHAARASGPTAYDVSIAFFRMAAG